MKSVSPLSCTTGWKTRALRRIPSRQQESSLFAKTRPVGGKNTGSRDGHVGKDRRVPPTQGGSQQMFVALLQAAVILKIKNRMKGSTGQQ